MTQSGNFWIHPNIVMRAEMGGGGDGEDGGILSLRNEDTLPHHYKMTTQKAATFNSSESFTLECGVS
jgi:hypothetical protein